MKRCGALALHAGRRPVGVAVAFFVLAALAEAGDPPASQPRLIMAFASLRDRPAFASVHFYQHDGAGDGGMMGQIPLVSERADYRPALFDGGSRCWFSSKQVGGHGPLINGWHLEAGRPLPEPGFNARFGARIAPATTHDGSLLLFCVWEGGAAGGGGWDLALFDTRHDRLIELPGLNTADHEQHPAISGDGALVAYASSRPGGRGGSDIYLYDLKRQRPVDATALNSPSRDHSPALSGNGRFVAFVSDRPGGAGGQDVWLFDLQESRFVDLPGLNSVAHEQSPAMTADARYLAIVSERVDGAGERDIYLYDRQERRLLPTPGLNSAQEDFDPALALAPRAITRFPRRPRRKPRPAGRP